MAVLKRCVCSSQSKYIRANVVDRNIVEHALKNTFECGRTCNAKASEVVWEVLAMRLKVEDGIHVDVDKEIERKGFQSHNKVWAVVNAIQNNGIWKKVIETCRRKLLFNFGPELCNDLCWGTMLRQWLERYTDTCSV